MDIEVMDAWYPKCNTQTINLNTKKILRKRLPKEIFYLLVFLKQIEITFDIIKIEIVMRFFSYLFYPRGLNPYTTFHYRAASQPLSIYFNIDLRVQAVLCINNYESAEAQGTFIKTGLELK